MGSVNFAIEKIVFQSVWIVSSEILYYHCVFHIPHFVLIF
jgi:hypothetical protein